MKNYKKITISAVALSSLILLAACGKSSTNHAANRAINYSLSDDILTLDSSLAADANSINTLLNVEAGLVRFDKNAQVTNDLAKSITISKDGLTYTVELKPNLKWSNGDKLTAQDFVYGWQRTIDPKTGSEYAQALYPVKNAEAINLGKLPLSDLGIKADGDSKLTITLAQPTPYFEKLMTEQAFYPLNQKFVEKYGKSYGTTSDKTLYDGPYKFAAGNKGWTGTNKDFSLVKNPEFYDAKAVKSDGVNDQVITNTTTAAQLFKQGKLDVATLDTPELVKANQSNKAFKILPAPRIDELEFNQSGKVKALTNEKIREAINLATNRQELLTTAAPYFTIAKTATPSGLDQAPNGEDFAKYAAQNYTFDAKKAAQLFKAGLKEEGLSNLTLNLEGDSDDAFHKAAVDYLKGSLQSTLPDLMINEVLVPKAQREKDAQNGNFQIILSSWGADYNEPSDFLTNFTTNSPMNDGKFSNPAFDKAMQAATSTPDITQPTKLYADYKAAENALYSASNIDPLDTEAKPILINPDLTGVSEVNSGMIYDLRNAEIK